MKIDDCYKCGESVQECTNWDISIHEGFLCEKCNIKNQLTNEDLSIMRSKRHKKRPESVISSLANSKTKLYLVIVASIIFNRKYEE